MIRRQFDKEACLLKPACGCLTSATRIVQVTGALLNRHQAQLFKWEIKSQVRSLLCQQKENNTVTHFKVIKPEAADEQETHQEHVFEIVEIAKEFLWRDFFWVKDVVLSQVGVLLLHVFMQQIQLLMLFSGSTHKAVNTCVKDHCCLLIKNGNLCFICTIEK